jgi:hypothetical protein
MCYNNQIQAAVITTSAALGVAALGSPGRLPNFRKPAPHSRLNHASHLTEDSELSIIGNFLKAADYHAARGERRDFDFWSTKADEIADMYREYGAAIHAQYQARF